MFNLLKLLGGISGDQNTQTPDDVEQPATPQPSAAPPPEPTRHNYMADVIERHERISQRVKK